MADGETAGWFDVARDGGYVRRASSSYLADAGDAYIPTHIVRQYGLRRGDAVTATVGRDQRGRITLVDVLQINGDDPALAARRPDFSVLTAEYPDRKLTLETAERIASAGSRAAAFGAAKRGRGGKRRAAARSTRKPK